MEEHDKTRQGDAGGGGQAPQRNNDSGGVGSTPYDDVFRTLLVKAGRWRIPFINRMFNRNYSLDEKVQVLSDELYTPAPGGGSVKRTADSVLQIAGGMYHVECQSTPDGSIVVRMAEYDMAIAVAHSTYSDDEETGVLDMPIPASAILYLRKTRMPRNGLFIRLHTGDGQTVSYPVLSMQLQTMSIPQLMEHGLLFLIPFTPFLTERWLDRAEQGDREALDAVTGTVRRSIDELNTMYINGRLTAEHYLLFRDMLRTVARGLTRKHDNTRKQMEDIMTGRILTFEGEDLINKGKSQGLAQGLAQGREEGRSEGLSQGREEGMLSTLVGLVIDGKLTAADAARYAGCSEQQMQTLVRQRQARG